MNNNNEIFIKNIGVYFYLLKNINETILNMPNINEYYLMGNKVFYLCVEFNRLFPTKLKSKKLKINKKDFAMLKTKKMNNNLKTKIDITIKILNLIEGEGILLLKDDIPNIDIKKTNITITNLNNNLKRNFLLLKGSIATRDKFLTLRKGDGILLLKDKIPNIDIENEFKTMLKKYDKIIIEMREIRNKFQHEPHNIRWKSQTAKVVKNDLTVLNFKYSKVLKSKADTDDKIIDKTLQFKKSEFINLLIEINNIFIKLKKEFIIISKDLKLSEEPHYKEIVQIDLEKYNKNLKS